MKPRMRRAALGALGGALIISGAILAWSFGRQELYDFYFIPMDKGDRLFPRRWQDFVILGAVWTILLAWLWVGYWLLRRAVGPRF